MEEASGDEGYERNQEVREEDSSIAITNPETLTDLESTDTLEPGIVPQASTFVEDPLSNEVVLRNVFTFLNEQDLEACCNVSKQWRNVADPLVFSHYDIQLGGDVDLINSILRDHKPEDQRVATEVIIKERDRYNRKNWTKNVTNFEGATRKLEAVLLTQKAPISLSIHQYCDMGSESVETFLKKFGHLVVDLDFRGKEISSLENPLSSLKSPLNFCKLLITSLPNLRKLNCCGVEFVEDSIHATFNPDLPENKHSELREIYVGTEMKFLQLMNILKMAPNLEKIHQFPLWLIKAVVICGKGRALKSLATCVYMSGHKFPPNGETVVTAFEKLAQLEPKLTEFEFLPSSDMYSSFLGNFPDKMSLKLIEPFVFSTMQSSSESLQSLYLKPSSSYGFQRIPPLKGLKILKFGETNIDGKFFSKNISLEELFPKVAKICIGFHANKENVKKYLRENIVYPWGHQIKELTVRDLDSNSIPFLQRRFPSIEVLKIENRVGNLRWHLLAFAQFWPVLKSLTVRVKYAVDPTRSGIVSDVDCSFMGIDKRTGEQLVDPSMRKKFTEVEINGFKKRSTLGKFTGLNHLKIVLNRVGDTNLDKLAPLTSLADEFGFSLIPDLKVTWAIERKCLDAEVIKSGLEELLARNKNIKIEEDYVDEKW